MAYLQEGYYSDVPAAMAVPNERLAFIRKTYSHLAMAVLAFIGIEYVIFSTGSNVAIFQTIAGAGRAGWIALMIGFVAVGFVAQKMARSQASVTVQYLGLALYVAFEALIFVPILSYAMHIDPKVIGQAGVLTGGLFAALSAVVLFTKADFSWMRTGLMVLGIVAMCTVIAGAIMGFSLGLWFSAAMIALAAGYIVYDTSNILHHYPTSMYVAAALELFASVALLFYYILRFALEMQGRRD